MPAKRISAFTLMLIIALATVLFDPTAQAATETVIHSFALTISGKDGGNPASGVIFDKKGNLYGTTPIGGLYAQGVLFKLSPNSSGGWDETVLHHFGRTRADGILPVGNLAMDAKGNIYGATQFGGDAAGGYGGGTVYEMSPHSDGTWTEKILYALEDCNSGCEPQAGVILDAAGNLYGTNSAGGPPFSCNNGGVGSGCGNVFELIHKSGGWKEKILYQFKGGSSDGFAPQAGLVMDLAGNLYGTAPTGGVTTKSCSTDGYLGCGVVFELKHSASGWHESIIHFFTGGKDGYFPSDSLVLDPQGHMYGTTQLGGGGTCPDGFGQVTGCGTVFQLTQTSGKWSEKVIHRFPEGTLGTVFPFDGLIVDSKGNLYGTTSNAVGNVFELSPRANGKWHLTVIYAFTGGADGLVPYAGVVADSKGNLYGTTSRGGTVSDGVVFKITR